ncbi:ArsR/SmtB family transcription factor [Streptomyces sp. NPDC048436]|uniref:ArsR/SmtB family transcription factor n=1 Tax=Streptomyces sp. NPDC048436 TaxID=3365550 RepID=UPI0037112F7E
MEVVLQATGLLPRRLDEREQKLFQFGGTARTCSSFALPVSKATVTHHFRALREAGLIQQVARGNSRMASLRRADLERRFPGLLGIVAAEPEE